MRESSVRLAFSFRDSRFEIRESYSVLPSCMSSSSCFAVRSRSSGRLRSGITRSRHHDLGCLTVPGVVPRTFLGPRLLNVNVNVNVNKERPIISPSFLANPSQARQVSSQVKSSPVRDRKTQNAKRKTQDARRKTHENATTNANTITVANVAQVVIHMIASALATCTRCLTIAGL